MKLVLLSAKEVFLVLKKLGYEHVNSDGRHRIWAHPDKTQAVTVPDHKQLKRGTLRNVIHQTGVSVDMFYACLDR